MFDLNEYLKLEQIGNSKNNLLNLFLNIDIDTEKMEKDIQILKTLLMKVAELYEKKIIFVVDKDKVEMFEAIE